MDEYIRWSLLLPWHAKQVLNQFNGNMFVDGAAIIKTLKYIAEKKSDEKDKIAQGYHKNGMILKKEYKAIKKA